MARLTEKQRDELPDETFAYIDRVRVASCRSRRIEPRARRA